MRTPDSRTFANEDGTFRTELGSEPMFAEDFDGDLVEPDPTPVGRPDSRWEPAAGRDGLSFGATAGASALGSLSFGQGRSVSWSIEGAAVAPGRRDGDVVRYEGVFEGVDVEMEASLTGVKETIILHDASVPIVYDFPLELTGLTATLDDPYGSVVLSDAESGESVGVIPSAWAQDAGRGPNGETPDPGPVAYELVGTGSETVLRVSVDETWFRDPARVFPIQVDPTVGDYKLTGDTWVHNAYPTTNRSTSPILKTGGGGGNRRTYFARWDVGWLAAATILSADYRTLNSYSYSCNPTWFGIYRLTSDWNPATVTWGSQPSYSDLLGAHNAALGYNASCPAGWLYNPMTGVVQGWVDGVYPAFGVTGRVYPDDSYNDNFSYKEFLSSEAGGNGGQVLQIVWSPWRAKYAVSGKVVQPTAVSAGSINIRVTNKAPTTWNATGANRYRLGYHVYASNGTTLVNWEGGRVNLPQNVGWGQSVTVNVPLAPLPVGNYQFKFDLLQEGVRWFSHEGVHADLTPLAVPISVGNTPPGIESAAPAGMSETRTPNLTVVGKNPDNYPSGALQYLFKICEDAAMATGCVQSAWGTASQWKPTHLAWGRTYYWNAAVREQGTGALTTLPAWKAPLTPTVEQPTVERHFGSDEYAQRHGGVNPSIGNFVATFTDLQVAAAGLPVEISRTYNSMDTRVGAFGPGWSTSLDLSADPEDGGTLLVSFPDGRRERYGQNADGTWTSPPGNASVLRPVNTGGWELQRPDGVVYVFDAAGIPLAIRDGWGHALSLSRDPATGLIDRVTNAPSGRYMDLGWDDVGPDGAQVVTSVEGNPPEPGVAGPVWTYTYDGGRLSGVCAPGEPEPDNQCTAYSYYGTGRGAEGKLSTITRQQGNTAVNLDYRTDGSVAWVENGTADRWTFTDGDDEAEGTYHPVNGWRATNDLQVAAMGTLKIDVTGSGGVPEQGVQAVVVNIDVASYGSGWLAAYPSGTPEPSPGVSTMDYSPGIRSTLHTVAVGSDGKFSLTNHGSQAALITADVVGWYAGAGVADGSVFVPVATKRILDTRVSGQGPALGAGTVRSVQVTGKGGVPSDGVRAVVFNLEMVGATAGTDLVTYATGASRPAISTAVTGAGMMVDNLQVAAVGDGGKINVHNAAGSVHVLVDVVGYFADPALHEGSVFRPLTNYRLLDSRGTTGQWTTPWLAGGTRPVLVPGQGSIPGRGVTAVVGDVQAVTPATTNTNQTTPTGTTGSGTTYIAQAGQNVGNHLYVGLGDTGSFDLTSQISQNMIVDVVGYFTPVPRRTTVSDPRGHTVEYRHDELGRLVGRTDEDGYITAYAYNDAGFLSSTRDEAGGGHVFAYDDDGHLTSDKLIRYYGGFESQIRDWESTTYYGYVDDAANPARDGKLAWVADGRSAGAADLSYRTTYEYDTLGQPLAVRGPALPDAPQGVGVTTTYSDGTTKPEFCPEAGPAGLPQTETAATGLTTTYCYDALGDLREVHHPSGLLDRYVFDGLGREISHAEVSDSFPDGITTTREYDLKNRVTTATGPTVTTAMTDPVDGPSHQAETTTTYTPNGQPDRVTVSDTVTGTSRWVDHAYDDADRIVATIDNADRETAQTYDPNGNVATRTGVDGATLRYAYDNRNNERSVTALDVVDDPIGAPGSTRNVALRYRYYDQAGRVWMEIDAAGRTSSYRWSPDGSLEHARVARHRDTDPTTGLPAGPERTFLLAAAEIDRAGNPVRELAGTNVAHVDDFAESTLSPDWQTDGAWSIVDGELTATAPGRAWRPGTTDGQVGVTVGSAAPLSVLFRVQDASNYFQLVWDGTLLVAYQVVDGVANDFEGNLAAALSDGDRIEVSFTGNRLRVFRSGTLVMETTIPADTAGTGVGVVATGAGQSAERFRFDAYGRVENGFDAYGRQVSATADPGGAGLRTEWSRLPDGRPSAVIRSSTTVPTAAAVTRLGYDPASGLLTWSEDVVADPDTEVSGDEVLARTQYGYDQRGLVTSTISPEGAQVDHSFDQAGRLSVVTGPPRTVEHAGQAPVPDVRPSESYEYTAFGELRAVRDAAGKPTVFTVDARGFTTETKLPAYAPPGGSPVEPVVATSFDAAGRVLTRTDPLGEVTRYTYNTLGLLVADEAPASGDDPPGVARYVYDNAGRLREQTDPTGAVTRQRRDLHGRVTGVEEVVRQPVAASYVSSFTLGDAGDVVASRTHEGVVSTTAYDLAGRPVATSDAEGNRATYAYDGLGRIERETAPDGRQIRSVYDLVGNKVVEQAYGPDGITLLGERHYSWSKDRQLEQFSTPRGTAEGFSTVIEHDAAGQQIQRTTAVAPGQAITETWGYDELGSPTRYTDGRNNTVSQTYNSLGLPEDAIEPAAGGQSEVADRRWRTVYDAAGRPISQQAPGGVVVTSTYDERGRLIEQQGSGAQAATATRTFDYDQAGRLLIASTPTGAQTFSYDDRGLMLAATGVAGDSSYSYDGDGRVTDRTDASGATSFTYDDRGLPDTVTSSLAGTAEFDHDSAGRPSQVDYGDGTVRTLTYDTWGRPDVDRLATGATELYRADYDHDLDGNVVAKTITGADVPVVGSNQYGYDWASRLTSWTDPAGAVEGYAWDAASNRTQSGATTATYDEQNRLVLTEGPGGSMINTWAADGTLDQQKVQRRVVLVVADPAALTQAESLLLWASAASGYAVTTIDDVAPAPTTGADVLVIAPTVDAAAIGDRYKDVAVPIVNLAAGTWQANGVTSAAHTDSSGTSAHVADTEHPLAAGKSGEVALVSSANTISAVPAAGLGAGAITAWTSSASSTDVVVAGYERGSATPGGPAAERRVAVGLSAGAVSKITLDGWAVIDAAMAWADDNDAEFGTTDFDFDAFEQLSKITTPDGAVVDQTYDALGRRLTSPTGALAYAGGDIRPAADGAGRYQPGPFGALGIDDLTEGDGTWAHADNHSDVVGTFHAGATSLTDAQAFSPWGQPLAAGDDSLPLGYQSERRDLPGGLIGMGVREYDPDTGTFISHDPIVDPAVLNGYGYTPANPLGHVDPTGRQAAPVVIATGICAGLTAGTCAAIFGAAACISMPQCRDALAGAAGGIADAATGWCLSGFGPDCGGGGSGSATGSGAGAGIFSILSDYINDLLNQAQSNSASSDRLMQEACLRYGICEWGDSNREPGDQHHNDGARGGRGARGARGARGGTHTAPPPKPIWTPLDVILNPPAAADSALAALLASTGSAVPDYSGRYQNGVDTGNASMPTTPVSIEIATADPGPAVPEIILQLVTDNFALGAVTTPPLPPFDTGGPDALDAASCGYDVGQAASGGSDWTSSVVGCLTMGLPQPGGASVSPSGVGSSTPLRNACSFDGDTEVVMADGSTRLIEEVEEGDRIRATSPETGETQIRAVVAVLPHTDQLLALRTSAGEVITTEDHEFWNVTDRRWDESQYLSPGDRLLTADGDVVTVEGLDWSTVRNDVAYDLTVEDVHTFYVGVGDESVLVHNCNNASILRSNMEALGQYGPGYEAHHIVPHGTYANRAAAVDLAMAQAKLDRLGIDINDASNGVYLPKGCHQSVGHTNEMFRDLKSALNAASTADQARAVLRGIGQELYNKCL